MDNYMGLFFSATYHSVVCHFDAEVAVAVSVLENHSDLQSQQHNC